MCCQRTSRGASPNTAAGIRQLKRELKRFSVDLVVFEATGKWHRSLHAGGYAAAVVDPYLVRMFAKANRILAKTDPLDPRVLAMFAAVMDPHERPPAAQALETLQEFVRARLSAVTELTALKNQRAAAQSTFLRRHLQRRISRMLKDIESLEAGITDRIASHPALARRSQIPLSIPGIGPVSAALLTGLAPIPDDSGERRGQRRIKGGRQSVRNVLYLAALSAAKYNPALRDFYRCLRDNGKLPKVTLIAVARKLVVLANALINGNRTWTLQPPNHASTTTQRPPKPQTVPGRERLGGGGHRL
jgi:transposase